MTGGFLFDEIEAYAYSKWTQAKRILCIVSGHDFYLIHPVDRSKPPYYECTRCERTRPYGGVW